MIVGETRTVRHTETGESAFVFDATPTLTVTLPDGTTDAPTVSVSPGTSNETQTLSAVVSFPQGGQYRLEWSMDVGADDPLVRVETYFAAWSDVYAFIRELLSRDADSLPDAKIDRELARLSRQIVSQCSSLGSYGSLSGDDRYLFDDMLAYGAAYALYNRPSSSTITGSGDVKKLTQDGLTVEYDVGTSVTSSGTAANWLSEYQRALGLLCPDALIDPARRARTSVPVSNLPNSFDPRDSLYPSDVERAAEAVG